MVRIENDNAPRVGDAEQEYVFDIADTKSVV